MGQGKVGEQVSLEELPLGPSSAGLVLGQRELGGSTGARPRSAWGAQMLILAPGFGGRRHQGHVAAVPMTVMLQSPPGSQPGRVGSGVRVE